MATSISTGLSSHLRFPVIGLGASAGGTEALITFFQEMPADNGMAFVIVMHLAQEQTSHLASILQNVTSMPVQQVTTTTAIEKNHVYVIAPSSDLQMVDDYLHVSKPAKRLGPQVAIDLFFRTLAESHRERATSIVLSGVGSDGSIGLAHVKEMGGVTLAQSPDDAKFDGMPNSAIATGKVDIVLPAVEMPQRLLELRDNARAIRLPSATDHEPESQTGEPSPQQRNGEKALQEVMAMLRARTSHDFRRYKRATVLRRLERRLQVNGIPDLAAYRDFLHLHPEETRLLLEDMLISVTHFFRDTEAFEALQREVMPALFANRQGDGDSVRVWAPGVATGEEAYSLAMLLEEACAASDSQAPFQLFATDIDEKAIAVARAGVYPETIITDVSPERLRQFFTKDQSHFRVKKKLRERVLFALHNVLSDPPFSRLDLVCCRNLMIYLDREAQAEALRTFHFALRPGGYLFLGSSESADLASKFFTVVDKKHRIYRASTAARVGGASALQAGDIQGARPIAATSEPGGKRKFSFGDLHQRLLEQFAPPSVLINRESEIVHLSDRAGRFLHYAGGEPSHNVVAVVHPGLGPELRTAIFQAIQGNASVESRRVRLMRDGRPYFVKMTARPVHDADAGDDFVLVLFDEVEDTMDAAEDSARREGNKDPVVVQLERELQRTRDQLQATIEQSETSTEELTASNEELQAINEELRSTTEELETSKEELQSINEELVTVNAELKTKVDETAKINDDLQNLITANDIGTIFVDRTMRIKRFTPRAADVFSIIASDVGRSLFDITHRLEYDGIASDSAAAFNSLRVIEREVRSTHGHWYIARFMPYRTTEDRIDGAVLTFIDITARREAEERLHEGERRMRIVTESTKEYAIVTLDENGLIVTWNVGATRMFGYEEGEAIGQPFEWLYPRDDREQGVTHEDLQRAREEGRIEEDRWYVRKDGSRVYCSGVLMRLDEDGLRGFAKIAREVNVDEAERKRDKFLAAVSHKLKSPLNLIYANAELLARSPESHRSLQVSRAADTIRRSAISQARLIDDLLDMSRLRTGELTISNAAVDWRDVVDRICGALDAEAHDKGIELVRNLPDNPVIIQADLARVEQVVWNLVGNALKSPGANRVDVSLAEDGNVATLQIEHDGSGIDSANLPHVFDMAERGRPPYWRDDELGIGLFLVKELVGLHGGTIKVESAGLASGARFIVALPLRRDTFGEAGDGQHKTMPLEGLSILIVDEDASANDAFQMLLEAEGAKVACASSGTEAIQAVQIQATDVVLSGLNLSGREHDDFLAALRATPGSARLPVIALSAVVHRGDRQRAVQSGYSAYLTKPVVLDELLAAIAGVRVAGEA